MKKVYICFINSAGTSFAFSGVTSLEFLLGPLLTKTDIHIHP